MKSWLQKLFRPSPKRSVFTLVVLGVVVGIAGMLSFDFSMKVTSTEEFCISCHEMSSQPYALIKDTGHFRNQSGVRPTCSDCHLPKTGWPKMWRTIQASREVWSSLTGKINTPEKYLAHTPVMKEREIARMRANDSQECRNCHDVNAMDLEQQSRMAKRSHGKMQAQGKTCIDCHDGLAHDRPAALYEPDEGLTAIDPTLLKQ